VSGSQAYTSFRSDWIADDEWSAAREAFLNQYPHLTDADVFLEQAKVTLDTHTAAANRVWPDLQDEVWIKDSPVHLARLEAQELPPGEVNHYPTPSLFGALHRGSRRGNFVT
jgi:hypothetical protein